MFVVGIYNSNGQIAQAVPVSDMTQAEARREFFEAKFAEDGPYKGFIVRIFMLNGDESPPEELQMAPEVVEVVEVVAPQPVVVTPDVMSAYSVRAERIAVEERKRLDRLADYDESCGYCDGCYLGDVCEYEAEEVVVRSRRLVRRSEVEEKEMPVPSTRDVVISYFPS